MEGALTYVEDQLSALRSYTAPAPPPMPSPAPPQQQPEAVTPTSSNSPDDTATEPGRVKVVKIPDPSVFDRSEKDQILYDDWHLQMLNKMSANEELISTHYAGIEKIVCAEPHERQCLCTDQVEAPSQCHEAIRHSE